MKKNSLILYGLLLMAMACKQENDVHPVTPIATPVITSISKTAAQPGDTITVKGQHLQQDTLTTSLAINGRPAHIVKLHTDSLQAIVPGGAYSGKLLLTVSRGNTVTSVYGPALNIIPIATIDGHFPLYLYGGDTVTLLVKNFAAQDADNYLEIDGKVMKMVYNNGKDTLKAVVPADANTGVFRWRTYGGSLQTGQNTLYVRKKSYNATTIKEWVAQDPGFRFVHELFTQPASTGRYEFQFLTPYIDGTSAAAFFLPQDSYYQQQGINTVEQFRQQVLIPRAYTLVPALLASGIPGFTGTAGTYKSVLTRSILQNFPSDPEFFNNVDITKEGEDYYIQARAYYGLMDVKLKATYLGKVGNCLLYQVDKPLPYDFEYN